MLEIKDFKHFIFKSSPPAAYGYHTTTDGRTPKTLSYSLSSRNQPQYDISHG